MRPRPISVAVLVAVSVTVFGTLPGCTRDPGSTPARHVAFAAAPGSRLSMDTLIQYWEALAIKIEALQGNIANAEAFGYKRVRVEPLPLAGRCSATGIAIQDATAAVPGGRAGAGLRVAARTRDLSQGKLVSTNRCFDIAIEGAGFFRVQSPDGSDGYTRDGQFSLNSRGHLVTRAGCILQPQVTVPQDALYISIEPGGQVTVRRAATPNTMQILGQIDLFRFVSPEGLSLDVGGLYHESAAAGRPVQATPGQQETGVLRQHFLEGSNVNVMAEFARLVVASDQYHAIFLAIQRATVAGR